MLLALQLMTAQATDDSIYSSRIKKCFEDKDLIPLNISANFDFKIVKNHIELVVNNDGAFDYYEMNWKDYCCYKATDLNEKPIRTESDQEDCDK